MSYITLTEATETYELPLPVIQRLIKEKILIPYMRTRVMLDTEEVERYLSGCKIKVPAEVSFRYKYSYLSSIGDQVENLELFSFLTLKKQHCYFQLKCFADFPPEVQACFSELGLKTLGDLLEFTHTYGFEGFMTRTNIQPEKLDELMQYLLKTGLYKLDIVSPLYKYLPFEK